MVQYSKRYPSLPFLILLILHLVFLSSEKNCLHLYPLDEVNSFTTINNTYLVAAEKGKVSFFQSKSNTPIFSFPTSFDYNSMIATANFLIFLSASKQSLNIYKVHLERETIKLVCIYQEFEGNILAIEPSVNEEEILISNGKSIHLIDLQSCCLIKKMELENIRRIHSYNDSFIMLNEKLNIMKINDDEEGKKTYHIEESLNLTSNMEIELNINSVLMGNILVITQKKSIYYIDIENPILKERHLEQELYDFEPTLLNNLEFLIYMTVEGNLKYLPMNSDSFEVPEGLFMNIPLSNISKGPVKFKEFGKEALLLKNKNIFQYNLSTWPVNFMSQSGCEAMCRVSSCKKCKNTNLTECLVYNQQLKTSCPSNCSSCDLHLQCTVCKPGYMLFGKDCLKIKTCLSGEYLEIGRDKVAKCKNCSTGCIKCTNLNECQACSFEYKLTQGICAKNIFGKIFRTLHNEGSEGGQGGGKDNDYNDNHNDRKNNMEHDNRNDKDGNTRNENNYNNNMNNNNGGSESGNSYNNNMNNNDAGGSGTENKNNFNNNNGNYRGENNGNFGNSSTDNNYKSALASSSSYDNNNSSSGKTIGIISGSVIGSLAFCFCLFKCVIEHKKRRTKISEFKIVSETSPSSPINYNHAIGAIGVLCPENQVKLNTVVLPEQAKNMKTTEEETKINPLISIPKGIPAEGSKLKDEEKNQIPVMGIAIEYLD